MHDFHFRDHELYCEELPVRTIAERVGTPVYIYSHKTLLDHFRKLQRAFKSLRPLICFSMKANSNLAVCRALVQAGAGLDVVSGGELYKARKIGCAPRKIVYASVGKTAEEIRMAIRMGILMFNVESLPELEAINREAGRLRRRVQVALRLNPHVAANTHHKITTGTWENKFGIDMPTAARLFAQQHAFPWLRLTGIHLHLGSQITEARPFLAALRKVQRFVEALRRQGIRLSWINLGGGLGIVYQAERPQTAQQVARAVGPALRRLKLKVILEPGRFIAGNSGILVTRVLYLKATPRKQFVVVDAGMSDLIRPALYDAYHHIVPLTARNGERPVTVDVVGPICESGDFLAKNRALPPVVSGELLAVMGAGAYGFTMTSHYNSRPKPAEVLVRGQRFFIVREREGYADLIRHERIPHGAIN